MSHNIIGAAIAFFSGFLIAFINFLFSKKVLIKVPEKFSLVTVARQIIQVGFLALVYFVGTKTQFAEPAYLLVSAVIGLTVPMFFFTKKLLVINKAAVANKNEKEADTDG